MNSASSARATDAVGFELRSKPRRSRRPTSGPGQSALRWSATAVRSVAVPTASASVATVTDTGTEHGAILRQANLLIARSCAFRFSSSRLRGGAFVLRE